MLPSSTAPLPARTLIRHEGTCLRHVVTLVLLAYSVVPLHAEPIPPGPSKITLKVAAYDLDLFTYKPKTYTNGPLVVVFHGMLRNADTYRDNAIGLADRFGVVVVAPLFDLKRFPNEAYQSGGLFKKGELQPKEVWTWSLVPTLVDEVRKLEGQPKMPYYLIGHSAGGQFLCRLTGFVPTNAERIVAANPGSHLFRRPRRLSLTASASCRRLSMATNP